MNHYYKSKLFWIAPPIEKLLKTGGLFLLFFLLPLPISVGCGPIEAGFQGYSFVNPAIVDQAAPTAPYFLRFEEVYDYYNEARKVQLNDNLREWKDIFCDQVKIADLHQVIYKSSVDDLELLHTSVRSKNIPLDYRLEKNSFARYLKKHKCLETVDYLIFAKRCEPHVVASADAWEAPPRDTLNMQRLIQAGLREFMATQSNYLRLRYAYQLIRLAHYAKDYQQTLDLYDFLLPKLDRMESLIYYWILGHRAGALKAFGRRAEAAYLYLQVFEYCPSKREQAFRSFSIDNDAEWQEVFLKCKNDRERAMLYALRARVKDSKAAKEMAKIYNLDPANDQLELLLVREIKKLEKDFLGLPFNDQRQRNKELFGLPRKEAGSELIDLQALARKAAKEKKVSRPELWQIADGYLEYLAGNLYDAGKTFAEVGERVTQPALKEQLELFELILHVHSYEEMDIDNENEVYTIIKENPLYKKYKDLPDFINDRVGHIYATTGHPGLAYRAHYDLFGLYLNPQLDIIDDLIEACGQAEKSDLETAMCIDEKGEAIYNQLLDMKGTLLFSQGKPEAAVETLRRIPREDWDRYQLNPFHERFIDCTECPVRDTIAYNKVEMIQRIFELEYKAKADFDYGGYYYYQLGNAYYNLSYFGHSWHALDFFRSGSNWHYDRDQIYDKFDAPFGNRENTSLSLALMYYEKARQLAHNNELAAKASFMAAKCQLNNYYMSKDCDYYGGSNRIPDLPPEYHTYYDLLRTQYRDTEFYQDIIEECKFFRAYARRGE